MEPITEERLAKLIAELEGDIASWPESDKPRAYEIFGDDLSALQELKQRRLADRWIPVSERLPKSRGEYIAFQPRQIVMGVESGPFQRILQWTGRRFISSFTVSHWMPLRPAPQRTEP